jgi:hypothetical protein
MARRPPKSRNPFEGIPPEIEREIREMHVEDRRECMLMVVEEALKYEKERHRDDEMHWARMNTRESRLWDAIRCAHEADQPITEVNEVDIYFAADRIERARQKDAKAQDAAKAPPSYENVVSLLPKGNPPKVTD